MPTLTLNKGGSIVGTVDTTQAAARDETTGTSITQDAGSNIAVQYFKSSGRGGGTFRYVRSFLQFDASAITGTVTAATLNVESHGSSNSGDLIVIASDAFWGASSDLVNGDFDNVFVPKMAEDAVMSTILYNLSKIRTRASAASGLYKQEAAAKMRNAKIRLSNMKVQEMTNIFRNKAKWIKH